MLQTALLLAAVAVSQIEIETKYDKSNNYTMYTRQLSVQSAGEYTKGLSIFATHSGEKRKRATDSDFVTLLFAYLSSEATFKGDHKVIIKQSRDEFAISSNFKERKDEKNNRIAELFYVEITIGELRKRLNRDEPWEVKIGTNKEAAPVGSITRGKIKDFLDFIQAPLVDEKDQDEPKQASLRNNGAGAVSQHDIETNYDKFRDYTAYTKELQYIIGKDDGERITIYLFATHNGEERKRLLPDDEVTLMIYRRGKRWRYLKDHEVIMMEGRNRFKIETDYSESMDDKNHGVNEHIHASMTIEEARKRLESGRNWEIKIGVEEPIQFARNTLKKIKEFLDYLQSSDASGKKTEPTTKAGE
jgi:hypothetical protein